RISSSQGCDCTHSRGGGAFRFRIYLPSDSPEHDERIEDAERKSPPQAGADKPKPCEIDKGCTEQRDEKPVSPGCLEAQDADTRMAARPRIFPHRHQSQEREDGQEENCRRKGPGHPSARHEGCEPVAFAVFHRQGHGQREGDEPVDGEDNRECEWPATVSMRCCRHQTLPRAKPLAM